MQLIFISAWPRADGFIEINEQNRKLVLREADESNRAGKVLASSFLSAAKYEAALQDGEIQIEG